MSEITLILEAVKNGDRDAAQKLLPLTYEELRRIAGQMMANERRGAHAAADRPDPRGLRSPGRT